MNADVDVLLSFEFAEVSFNLALDDVLNRNADAVAFRLDCPVEDSNSKKPVPSASVIFDESSVCSR